MSDAVRLIEDIGAPVLLIGQSMGALNSLVLAARRPDLVTQLLLVEAYAWNDATPSADDWSAQWPVPFGSLDEARVYFDSNGLDGKTWAQSLEARSDGYWPRFRAEDMVEISRRGSPYDYRAECANNVAPTLVVSGSRTWLDLRRIREVASLIRNSQYVELDAGHDVHLDNPVGFENAVCKFLDHCKTI